MDPAALTPPNFVVDESHISIRGVRLRFDELLDEQQLSRDNALRQREILKAATPFEHVVFKGLFNDRLLQLIHDEFDLATDLPWKQHVNKYEDTRRSMPGAMLGPAAQLYFWLVNSARVIDFLSAVTAIDDLIPDQCLLGGGMHETRNGGHFSIHRDFEVHHTNGLANAMVFITYLNKDWLPSYQGFLELWDPKRERCVKKLPPDFGNSLLMPHGPHSYHGYATPLNMPKGRTRRSVATYYYTNPKDLHRWPDSKVSKFLYTAKLDIAKDMLKQCVPPILWNGFKRFKR
jgi:2OG-Fe(II) oxygenase superfamily